MRLQSNTKYRQSGLSLGGFIVAIIIFALLAIVGMRVVPTVVEYAAIKKAIILAKENGGTAHDIQSSFDRQRSAGYIDSITGKDLEITRTASGMDVSVAYQKKIALYGPVSLVIDYAASTGNASAQGTE